MWKPKKSGNFLTLFACEIVSRLLYSLREIHESIKMVETLRYEKISTEPAIKKTAKTVIL